MSATPTHRSPVEQSARFPVWLLRWTAAAPERDLHPHLAEHLQYMVDLESRGVLLASGPLAEPDGTTRGDGLSALVVREESDARAFADDEPFTRRGLRTYTLQRWTLVKGTVALTVRLSDSSARLDAVPGRS